MSWLTAHKESERLAGEAHIALHDGDTQRATHLFRRAAEAERDALKLIDRSKSRTWGATAVSAVALWYKAGDFATAQHLLHQYIDEPDLPGFARKQLQKLFEQILAEERAQERMELEVGRAHGSRRQKSFSAENRGGYSWEDYLGRLATSAMASYPEPERMRVANWTRARTPSVINELLAWVTGPDIISFALNFPAPELFPREAYARAAERVLATNVRALQYGPSFRPLKAQIAGLMKRRGVECRPEQVVLTSGAHQALSLLARYLLDPGGRVMLERVAYTGFQQVIEPFQPELLVVPTGLEHGIDVDAVETYLAGGARPAFMYVVSDGHNPLGVSIPQESRDRLVELARRFGVPIVEDDAYGLLHYGDTGTGLLPMRAQEDRWVFYVGSFSKILAPGARIGWIIAPEELAPVLSGIKDTCDLDMNTFAQRTVSAFIEDGNLDGHVEMLREEYRARRNLMDAMLRAHFPEGSRWSVPSNGTLIWAELPEGIDCGKLLTVAVEQERVAFAPGHAFTSDGTRYARNCMRLNFSFPSRAEIEHGIAALGRVIRAHAGAEVNPRS